MTMGKEWKLILLFTLPIIAGNILQQLYNTVDGIVVGRAIGEDAFAGVGTCGALGFIFLSVAMGLGTGVSVVISQYFGARRYNDLNAAIDTSLLLMGGIGLVFSGAGILLTPFLVETVLNTPATIAPYAVTYFRIYAIGLVFQFIYNGIASTLRGLGDSMASLYFLLITSVLNAGLALLFVIAFHWGVAGTAIATVISQAVCAGISYIYMKKRFAFENSGKHFDRQALRHILRIGIPSAIQGLIISFGNTAMQRLVNGFGETTIAAFAAGNRVMMLLMGPIFSFQAGLATFTGQNIGADRVDRVKRGLWSTAAITTGLSILICIVLFIFASSFIRMFGVEGEALKQGIEMLRFYGVILCIFSFQMIVNGVLQGAGDIMIQTVTTLLALGIRVALGYLGVFLGILGYQAAWVTDPIGMTIATIIIVIRYVSGKWKTKAVVHLPAASGEPQELKQVCEE